jgi:hypothetical protein
VVGLCCVFFFPSSSSTIAGMKRTKRRKTTHERMQIGEYRGKRRIPNETRVACRLLSSSRILSCMYVCVWQLALIYSTDFQSLCPMNCLPYRRPFSPSSPVKSNRIIAQLQNTPASRHVSVCVSDWDPSTLTLERYFLFCLLSGRDLTWWDEKDGKQKTLRFFFYLFPPSKKTKKNLVAPYWTSSPYLGQLIRICTHPQGIFFLKIST